MNRWTGPRVQTSLSCATLLCATLLIGCGGGATAGQIGSAGVVGAGGTPPTNNPANDDPLVLSPVVNPPATAPACTSISEKATQKRGMVDIIFVIDNSASMFDEIFQVEKLINEEFSRIISESGVDYRVIMLTTLRIPQGPLYTWSYDVCISAPLGPGNCDAPDFVPAHNPPRFFHYSAQVSSTDSWCQMLDAWKEPDEVYDAHTRGYTPNKVLRQWTPLSPSGWSAHLREEAFKSIVVITDDSLRCFTLADYPNFVKSGYKQLTYDAVQGDPALAAAKFDRDLLALSPAQFGTETQRKYRFHSIVGVHENNPPEAPWLPTDPIQQQTCATAEEGSNNVGYQELSKLTGGLRFPICARDYSAIFHALAEDTTAVASLSCEWEIPAPPVGTSLDPTLVNVEFLPDASAAPQTIGNVANAAACGNGAGWHYNDTNPPTRVVACPATCDTIQRVADAEVHIAFGCETKVR